MPVAKTEPDLFDVDVLVNETEKAPFLFTLAGKVRQLPHVELLTFDQAIGMDTVPFATIGEIADEDTASAIRALPMFALEKLVEEWLKHSGVKAGESLASLRS